MDLWPYFFAAITRASRKYSLGKQRAAEQSHNERRNDITQSEKERYETRIDRDYSRELGRVETDVNRVSKLLTWFSVIGGLAGLISLGVQLKAYFSQSKRNGLLDILIPSAYASDGVKPELSPLVPYVAIAVLALMATSFLVALFTLMIVKDIKENQARIKAADNIVKTFGGFFTGLATTLLR